MSGQGRGGGLRRPSPLSSALAPGLPSRASFAFAVWAPVRQRDTSGRALGVRGGAGAFRRGTRPELAGGAPGTVSGRVPRRETAALPEASPGGAAYPPRLQDRIPRCRSAPRALPGSQVPCWSGGPTGHRSHASSLRGIPEGRGLRAVPSGKPAPPGREASPELPRGRSGSVGEGAGQPGGRRSPVDRARLPRNNCSLRCFAVMHVLAAGDSAGPGLRRSLGRGRAAGDAVAGGGAGTAIGMAHPVRDGGDGHGGSAGPEGMPGGLGLRLPRRS